jgi:hypothetical protein
VEYVLGIEGANLDKRRRSLQGGKSRKESQEEGAPAVALVLVTPARLQYRPRESGSEMTRRESERRGKPDECTLVITRGCRVMMDCMTACWSVVMLVGWLNAAQSIDEGENPVQEILSWRPVSIVRVFAHVLPGRNGETRKNMIVSCAARRR